MSTTTTPAANNALIDGLLYGVHWSGSLLTYGFPNTAGQYGGAGYAYDHDNDPTTQNANEATGMSPLSTEMRTAIIRAMNDLQAATNMDVARLLNSNAGTAQLRFADTTTPRPNNAGDPAYANFPDWTKAGDAWFDTGSFNTAPVGSYEYAVAIHELGHLLGLKHGHEGVAGATALPTNWDSIEFSIMTYRTFIGASGADWADPRVGHFAQSWMMLDIRALQQMYGADLGPHNGNTTYTFDDFDGEFLIDGVSQGIPGANIVFRTIWDGGGEDTYDFSRYDADLQMRIDLRPGDGSDPNIGWTDVDADSTFQAAHLFGKGTAATADDIHARGQVANAMLYNGDLRSLIENAIAGAGDDTIIGNQANNRLEGRDGNDVLQGFAGEDTLQGGNGVDHHDGGLGFDMVSYADAAQGVTVDLAFDRGDGSFGKATFGGVDSGDTFLSIEDIEGTNHGDQLFGWSGLSTKILGGGGNDLIDGRGGEDIIDAGLDNDTVFAYGGDIRLFDGDLALSPYDVLQVGGTSGVFNWAANDFSVDGLPIYQVLGFEIARGGIGGDAFTADARDLSFYGNAGNDTLTGGIGANVLEGGEGADHLTFGGGFDYADYRSDTSGVLVDIRSSIVTGGHATGDSWADAPEGLLGGNGNDLLGGSDGDNRILGRAGNDYIAGYAGMDTLEGDDGDDSIEGGLGADAINGGTGNDLIGDSEQILLLTGAEDDADDTLFGGAGNDSLLAGGGNDLLQGDTDDDWLTGGAGADNVQGGIGNDVLFDHTQQVAVLGGGLVGGAFVASDADTLLGGAGLDVIYASGGGDVIDGGADIDNLIMDFSGAVGPLAFTFSATKSWTMMLAGVVTATISNVEFLASVTGTAARDTMNGSGSAFPVVFDGGAGNDLLRGGAAEDVLIGSGGNDKLFGNDGNDLLVGGAGRDTLVGGSAADTFRWDVASEGRDVIQGFISGEDKLWIDASGFKGSLAENMDLAAENRFVLGAAPTSTRGQFLYDQGTGTLLWDVDGTRAKAAALIATFDPGTALAASDFLIVA